YFIGVIRTPWPSRAECPKRGDMDAGPLCRIEIAEPWPAALTGIAQHERLQILYWLHQARRDLVLQSPKKAEGRVSGTFALRSPMRPNPIASTLVRLVEVGPASLIVRGLDCLDGTPLIDVKPDYCPYAF